MFGTKRKSIRATRGITLIEVMIAAAMATVILGGLWSLLTTFSRLYQRGLDESLRLTLVRSLERQLNDDLRSVMELRDASSATTTTEGLAQASVDVIGQSEVDLTASKSADASPGLEGFVQTQGRVGLVGSSKTLLLDVWSIGEPREPRATQSLLDEEEMGRFTPTVDESTTTLDTQRVTNVGMSIDARPRGGHTRVPELRRIMFRFTPPMSLSSTTDRGLLRAVSTWESMYSVNDTGATATTIDESTEVDVGSGMGTGTQSASTTPIAPHLGKSAPIRVDRMPEVTRFELRYFDGRTWRADWDSRLEGRLPIAVEVSFDLDVTGDQNSVPHTTRGTDTEQYQTTTTRRDRDAELDQFEMTPAEPVAAQTTTNRLGQTVLGAVQGPGDWKPEHRLVVTLQGPDHAGQMLGNFQQGMGNQASFQHAK